MNSSTSEGDYTKFTRLSMSPSKYFFDYYDFNVQGSKHTRDRDLPKDCTSMYSKIK